MSICYSCVVYFEGKYWPHDFFLQCPSCNQPVNIDHFLLSNSMSPIHCLKIKTLKVTLKQDIFSITITLLSGFLWTPEIYNVKVIAEIAESINILALLQIGQHCVGKCSLCNVNWEQDCIWMFLFYTCRSFIGFQSCSTNITVSAPVKFRPSPPTCVVNNRMSMEGSLLNLKKYKRESFI